MAFELPGGLVIDFFSFDGIRRPDGALPKDIWHVALAVESRDAVMRCTERFAHASVPYWLETHDIDDVHVYATDPNGLTLEILAVEDGAHSRMADPDNARRVVEDWMETGPSDVRVGLPLPGSAD
jgi:hypothetical protein